MNSSRASAAMIMLFITSSVFLNNQFEAHAFVYNSPVASKYATQRLPQPLASLGTKGSIHPTKDYVRLTRNLSQMEATASNEDLEKEISGMRAKEIRKELESYGVSTKSFFEKSELVDALVKAREEGNTPIDNVGVDGDSPTSKNDSGTASTSESSTADRKERIQQEMEKCKKVKVGELKKELESYGVSTKSFFEKSEFVRAVAEARVDGPKKSAAGSGAGSRSVKEEPRDPSYRDVIVTKFTGDKGLLGGKLIDVRAR